MHYGNTRTAAFARFDGDELRVVHFRIIPVDRGRSSRWETDIAVALPSFMAYFGTSLADVQRGF